MNDPRSSGARARALLGCVLLAACSEAAPERPSDGAAGAAGLGAPYASSVESFEAGEGNGFGVDALPDVVLGPPRGKGNAAGSLDVLSLGTSGEIVLGFGQRVIHDGPGADFVVFENAFWPGGDASKVFAELGEVAVSEDGTAWTPFPCDTEGDGNGNFPGCAGVTPTLEYDAEQVVPLDPRLTGGDAFDLADVGVALARYVRVRDLATLPPAGETSGFDLDAVGAVDWD
ncbi:MAG TPA: hypothetical protein VJN18_00575 [Polyangiaceae bacterium]|nr:hypothetical protein [Polyangiaceae bacterium]